MNTPVESSFKVFPPTMKHFSIKCAYQIQIVPNFAWCGMTHSWQNGLGQILTECFDDWTPYSKHFAITKTFSCVNADILATSSICLIQQVIQGMAVYCVPIANPGPLIYFFNQRTQRDHTATETAVAISSKRLQSVYPPLPLSWFNGCELLFGLSSNPEDRWGRGEGGGA